MVETRSEIEGRMSAEDSPVVARRRVRLALREAREEQGLTQGQVAEAMEWSLSKVMRIENGEVTIALNDLKAVLSYLRITDPARTTSLIQAARASRQRQMWWDAPRFREHLTPAMRQLTQYEAESKIIKHWALTTIPGQLQTPAYAKAILGRFAGELSPADIDARLDARLRRRGSLLAKADPPEIRLLIDESILYRVLGGPHVVRDQMLDLVAHMRKGFLVVRVVPFDLDAPMPMFGAYDIFELNEIGDAVMYRETHLFDEFIEDRATLDLHREWFEQLWTAALDESESVRLLELGAKPKRPG